MIYQLNNHLVVSTLVVSICITINCNPVDTTDAYTSSLQPLVNIKDGKANLLSQIGEKARQHSEEQKNALVPDYGSFGRDRANTESESLLSRLDSKYTNAHEVFANIFKYQPVVDTINEEDKYGNHGETSRYITTGLVRSFDGLANIVNAILDTPYTKAKQLTKSATAYLNKVGGTLVGL